MLRILILAVTLFFASMTVWAQSPKKLEKFLEKNEYAELREYLDKVLEKDPVNATANYFYALYWIHAVQPDSAYDKILKAQEDLLLEDLKTADRMQDAGLNSSSFQQARLNIEAMGYALADSLGTEKGYQHFLDVYTEASLRESATSNRNREAFAEAALQDNSQAYKVFFEKYPEAAETPEARKRYEQRLFQERTREATGEDLEKFIMEHPDNPFRREAEFKIFDQLMFDISKENLLRYIRNPNFIFYRKQAVDLAYYLFQEDYEDWKQQLSSRYRDSLDQASALSGFLVVPYLEGAFGFMNNQGESILDPSYPGIEPGSCRGAMEDILLVYSADGSQQLIGRNGGLIYQGQIDEVREIGKGFVLVFTPGRTQLVHKGGHVIGSGYWTDGMLIGNKALGLFQNGAWEIASFTGKPVFSESFEEIHVEGNTVILMKDDFFDFLEVSQVSGERPLHFKASEYEIDSIFLYALYEEGWKIFDDRLIPLTRDYYEEIELWRDTWIFDRGEQIYLAGQDFQIQASVQDLKKNSSFLAVFNGQSWAVWNDSLNYAYQEATPLGKKFLRCLGENTDALYYHPDSSAISIAKEAGLRLIQVYIPEEDLQEEYLLLEEGGRVGLVGKAGVLMKPQRRYSGLDVPGPGYLEYEYRGKKGLLNFEGTELLKARYAGIGKYSEGGVAILRAGKFGLIYNQGKMVIPPVYEKVPVRLSSGVLMATKSGKTGLINSKNEELLEFVYDEIRPWSDSLVMASRDYRWELTNVYTGEVLLDDIRDYWPIEETGEQAFWILRDTGNGIMTHEDGILIQPTFSDIFLLSSGDDWIYLCEKYVEEADYHVMVYMNRDGEIIRKNGLNPEDYERLICEN